MANEITQFDIVSPAAEGGIQQQDKIGEISEDGHLTNLLPNTRYWFRSLSYCTDKVYYFTTKKPSTWEQYIITLPATEIWATTDNCGAQIHGLFKYKGNSPFAVALAFQFGTSAEECESSHPTWGQFNHGGDGTREITYPFFTTKTGLLPDLNYYFRACLHVHNVGGLTPIVDEKGNWKATVYYTAGDRVISGEDGFECVSNHVATDANKPPSAEWKTFKRYNFYGQTLSFAGSVSVFGFGREYVTAKKAEDDVSRLAVGRYFMDKSGVLRYQSYKRRLAPIVILLGTTNNDYGCELPVADHSGLILMNRHECFNTGNCTEIRVVCGGGYGGNIRVAIYDDVDGEPTNLLTEIEVASTLGENIIPLPISIPVVAEAYYWTAIQQAGANESPGQPGYHVIYNCLVTDLPYKYKSFTYGAFPAVISGLSDSTGSYWGEMSAWGKEITPSSTALVQYDSEWSPY